MGSNQEQSMSAQNINVEETHHAAVDESVIEENRPVTKQEVYRRREEVIDKALISAVKTLA